MHLLCTKAGHYNNRSDQSINLIRFFLGSSVVYAIFSAFSLPFWYTFNVYALDALKMKNDGNNTESRHINAYCVNGNLVFTIAQQHFLKFQSFPYLRLWRTSFRLLSSFCLLSVCCLSFAFFLYSLSLSLFFSLSSFFHSLHL